MARVIPWLVAGLGLAGLWAARGSLERGLIYYPIRALEGTPKDLGLEYVEARFRAEDGTKLHGWLVPGRERTTLLWCHGNAGNISHRLENIRLIRDRLGIGVFIFDYRGYGQSEGTPSEEGLYIDARAALTWLRGRPEVDPTRIAYFGRSLGAAVALDLAIQSPPRGLILETPFLSVRAMANRTLPGSGLLLASRYDNLATIRRITVPILILHGDRDEIVPFAHGRRLFEQASEPKTFFTIKGATHNDTYIVGGEPYWQAWSDFLASLR